MSQSHKSYLSRILSQHRSVCLEGIGTLRLGLHSAQVDQDMGVVYPPRQQIYYVPHCDQQLDPVLVRVVSLVDRISEGQASAKSATFMHELREELRTNRSLDLPEIGTIRQNFWGATYFEPQVFTPRVNEYFGLPEVALPTATLAAATETKESRVFTTPLQKVETTTAQPSRSNRRWGFVVGMLALLLATAFMLSQLPEKEHFGRSTAKKVQSVQRDASRRLNVAPEQPAKKDLASKTGKLKSVESESQKRIIIVGAFSKVANADRMVDRLTELGLKPYVEQKKLIKVGFSIDADELREKLAWAKTELTQDAWVLKQSP